MKIPADIKPITYLKSHSADMLKQVNETHGPVVITQNGGPKVLLFLGLKKIKAKAAELKAFPQHGRIVPEFQAQSLSYQSILDKNTQLKW